jgi:hypothetical protein
MIANNELEIMSKEAVVLELKAMSVYFQGGTMENYE